MNLDVRIPQNIHPIIMAAEEVIQAENISKGLNDNDAFSLVDYMNVRCKLTAEEGERVAVAILKERGFFYSKDDIYINQIASCILWCQGRAEPSSYEERLLRYEFGVTILNISRKKINQLSAEVLPALPEPTMLESTLEKVKAIWNDNLFKVVLGCTCFYFRTPLGKAIQNKALPLVKLAKEVLPKCGWQVLQVAVEWPSVTLIFASIFQLLTPPKSLVNRAITVVKGSLMFYGSLFLDRMPFIGSMYVQLSGRCSMRDDRDQELEEFFITHATLRA